MYNNHINFLIIYKTYYIITLRIAICGGILVRREMEYIYEVYKEKSFSRAAENLFISQPALSAIVKKASLHREKQVCTV